MARRHPTETVEICISYRKHPSAGHCAFVTAARVDTAGQMSIIDSRHLTASPERLVDGAAALAREWTLEYFLTLCEPF